MGNDEHSQNVHRRARELGEDPLAYCDRMEQEFREVWRRLDVSFDDFIRTTEPRHRTAVQELVRRCAEGGDVYEGHYEGWYCVSCEAFKQEKDLVDGLCPTHLRRPDWIREKNHFFRLSRYRDALVAHFDAHPEFLQPDVRRNEIVRLLEGGLDDISISRAGQAWGIPVPFDESSVVYVLFDALINYIAAVGYGTDPEALARWWPADLHVIGKDITRFHAVIWPAMLMSAGLEVPARIFGHGFVHFKGQKMSKSLGTVVDPLEVADRLGTDPLRLFLTKEIPYGGDGDFSWERFEERYNVDLANNLGNLVSRLTTMVDRFQGGRLVVSPLGPGPRPRMRPRRIGTRWTASPSTRGRRPRFDWSTPPTSTSPARSPGAWRAAARRPTGCHRCSTTPPRRCAWPPCSWRRSCPHPARRSCAGSGRAETPRRSGGTATRFGRARPGARRRWQARSGPVSNWVNRRVPTRLPLSSRGFT
jgi:methionyl-tRNA synthetase